MSNEGRISTVLSLWAGKLCSEVVSSCRFKNLAGQLSESFMNAFTTGV